MDLDNFPKSSYILNVLLFKSRGIALEVSYLCIVYIFLLTLKHSNCAVLIVPHYPPFTDLFFSVSLNHNIGFDMQKMFFVFLFFKCCLFF